IRLRPIQTPVVVPNRTTIALISPIKPFYCTSSPPGILCFLSGRSHAFPFSREQPTT
ncbi:hypothetical protein MPH_11708, partial [Macrophomina phaseolina MS6]